MQDLSQLNYHFLHFKRKEYLIWNIINLWVRNQHPNLKQLIGQHPGLTVPRRSRLTSHSLLRVWNLWVQKSLSICIWYHRNCWILRYCNWNLLLSKIQLCGVDKPLFQFWTKQRFSKIIVNPPDRYRLKEISSQPQRQG